MDKENLMWHTDSEETVFRTPVFAVKKKMQTAEAGPTGAYYSVSGSRCVCVVALYEGKLVMVRQFRHGSDRITSELPGGIVDAGETPEEAAGRELEEESGFRTGKVTLLGQMNPNPALFEKTSMLYDEFHPIFFTTLNKLHNTWLRIAHFIYFHVQNGNHCHPIISISKAAARINFRACARCRPLGNVL